MVDGTPFGRYRLIELLGRGGMGEVWRAFDTETQRLVALKLLSAQLASDPQFEQRFRREAFAAAGLAEPHVVPIHQFGEIDGRLYVDMRLIEGRDLESILRDGPLEPDRAIWIIDQVASALHAAHRIGLVHRDVKPSNILVAEHDFAYLIDFGIARAVGETKLTGTGSVIGTWAYLAPERLTSGQADPRADIYALTCVLHECLTGSQPFPSTSLEQQIAAHVSMPPPRPSALRDTVPANLDAVIAKGMAKDPEQRYLTTRELVDAARSAITDPMIRPESVLPTEPGSPVQPNTLKASQPDATGSLRKTDETHATLVRAHEAGPRDPSNTSRWRSGPRLWALIASGIALILVISLVTVFLVSSDTKPIAADQPGEVFLQPAASSGEDPFSPNSFAAPSATPQADAGPPPAPAPPANAEPGAIPSVDGSEPGAFGGTMHQTTCDAEGLIKFLGQDSDRAQAWAGVVKITSDQIPAFIRDLTPVLLRADTRVTDHRYVDGQVAPRQAVLEQGTAVLVNKFGEPTVRCYSGNPLLAPVATPVAPRYVGPADYVAPPGATGAAPVGLTRGAAWPGFAPTTIIVIFRASAIIDVFRLWDAIARAWFWRFTGIVIADVLYAAGVVPVRPVVATPAPQGSSDGARLQGTYAEHGQTRSSAGTSTFDNVLTFSSACPSCDATLSGRGGSATFQWIGSGWQSVTTGGAICAVDTQTLTPTVVANGFVQELTYYYATCNGTVRSSTMTRTGD
jgi:serine/threonine protein kinase